MKAEPIPIEWNPDLPIFASEPFLKTMGDDHGWIGGLDDVGQIHCVLPYAVIRKAFFRLIRFPVQTLFVNGELGLEEERAFLNSAVEHLRSTRADAIIPATFNTLFRTYPDGAIVAPYGSYILDLRRSEDELWRRVHQKHRNVIRNARKRGVKILSGLEHLETAFGLVRESFRRSTSGSLAKLRVESRMDYRPFRQQVLSLGEHVKVMVAQHEGTVQACAVIPFSKHSAYYMHGGRIPNPVTGAMNLLQWEAILQFRELGVRQFDFFGTRISPERGSKAEGIAKFKERFGGQLVRGYMWKLPFHPLKYALYALAARIRSSGDVVDQELHKLHASPSSPSGEAIADEAHD